MDAKRKIQSDYEFILDDGLIAKMQQNGAVNQTQLFRALEKVAYEYCWPAIKKAWEKTGKDRETAEASVRMSIGTFMVYYRGQADYDAMVVLPFDSFYFRGKFCIDTEYDSDHKQVTVILNYKADPVVRANDAVRDVSSDQIR